VVSLFYTRDISDLINTPDLVGGNPAHSMRVGTGWSLRSHPTQTILWFHDNSIWSIHWGKAQLLSICTLRAKRIWWRSTTLKPSSRKTKHTFCVHKFWLFCLPNQKEGNSNSWKACFYITKDFTLPAKEMVIWLFSCSLSTAQCMECIESIKVPKLYH